MSTEDKDIPRLITDSILTDGDWKDRYNAEIIERYNGMGEEGKDAVDTILALICGWNLSTIIDKYNQSKTTGQ